MGFNFRKSFKIAPGLKVNVTKKGISSLSVGKNGARVNVGKKGVKTTIGVPGTGFSYSKFSSYDSEKKVSQKDNKRNQSLGFGSLLLIGIVLLFFYMIFF